MRRLRRIKILATLGPASSDSAMIRKLFEAGADVFRINMSHTPHDKMRELVQTIRNVESSYGRPIGILVDLQGPKLRLGAFAEGSTQLKNGQSFVLDSDKAPGDNSRVQLPHPEILAALRPGHALLLDDGKVRLIVEETSPDRAVTRVVIGGKMSDRKGVSLPDTDLPVSAMTPKDRADLEAALVTGVDWIALSFVQRAEDVIEAKRMIRGRAAVMAKIEKPQAIDRLGEIIEASDALMVARGDLGVELPLERVPSLQKQMTRMARRAGKPVVVATQMLESMIQSPVPTRAEVSDVATAVYEGADAIMLSAESAAGKFPVEAVSTMNRIGEEVERDPTYRSVLDGAAPRAGDRQSATPSRMLRGRSPRRWNCRRSSAGPVGLDRASAWRASGRSRRWSRSRRISQPGANCLWCGACIAWSRKTRTTRTTWSIAPARSRSATALPRQASASSSSPACRSASPAPPTWCASPLSVPAPTRRCEGYRRSRARVSANLERRRQLLQLRVQRDLRVQEFRHRTAGLGHAGKLLELRLIRARDLRIQRQMHRGDGKTIALLFQGDVGLGLHVSAVSLASPRISDSAMVKQAACAAPISSSGLEPGLPSKRLAKP